MGKILVVGGAGYIGSHIVKQLLAEKHDVMVLDNFSTGYRCLVTGGELVEGRLGDSRLLDRIFSQNEISAVMHFAAFSLVSESVQWPLKYYKNNVAETVSLINAMVRHNVLRFIFSSTASVYGDPEEIPVVEDHLCRPRNPYGTSKLAVEQILTDCDAAYGLKSICLRYFNAAGADASGRIGEMHNPESHLIPLVLKSAISGKLINIFGADYPTPDGTCIRDYVHVTDLAQAHLLSLHALLDGAASTAYNLGNSIGYSVRQIIDLAGQVTGKKVSVIEDSRRPGDPAILVANADKIKRELGWRPEYEELKTIIETAWNWHNQIGRTNSGK
jgi:UDP-glucose 4-epimerase